MPTHNDKVSPNPPEYNAAMTSPFPRLVTSTYASKVLEAYVEVDSVAHGHWDTVPATLVKLVIAHISPSRVRSSYLSLTISATPPTQAGVGTVSDRSSPTPALLLHAPSFLRRLVALRAQQGYITCGVFAPPPVPGGDQEVVVKLDDPILFGLPDRLTVQLIIASHGRPFTIKGVIRPEHAETEGSQSSDSRHDGGDGVVIDPSVGPPATLCDKCNTSRKLVGSLALQCDRLDPEHIDHTRWRALVPAPIWPTAQLQTGDGVWVNYRTHQQ